MAARARGDEATVTRVGTAAVGVQPARGATRVVCDMHVHALPGVDDGASDWDESLEMARQAAACGVTHMVVTPHYLPGVYDADTCLVRKLTGEFRERIAAVGTLLEVLEGSEVFLSLEVPDLLRKGVLMTLGDGGGHLLVEIPAGEFPGWTVEVLFRVRAQGVVPVLAHPERNRVLQQRPGLLGDLVRQGTLVQVEAGSLTGLHGRRAQAVAERWIRQGWAHMLGSDAHGATGPRTPALLRDALARLGGRGAGLACPRGVLKPCSG
ncbi:MAG: CpsB/CapC family capsule biosynthesis tyrosine phosphatase [Bacillota bacterium]